MRRPDARSDLIFLDRTKFIHHLSVRALSRVPSRRCWRVGDTTPGLGGGGAAGVDAVARAFQSTYDASLRLRENGCREHTAAMALAMTGITLDLDALLIEGDANRSDDDA